MKLVIDREIWLRGEDTYNSYLLRKSDNKLCCVGIYLKALGVADKCLRGRTTVKHCVEANPTMVNPDDLPEWLLHDIGDKPTVGDPYIANDSPCRAECDHECGRESKISEIFAAHGVEVQFVN